MKGLFCLVLATFLISSPLLCAETKPLPLDTLLGQVQDHYDKMRTLKATFTQTSDQHNFVGHKEKLVQKGILEVKKPGKLRWDYTEPQKKYYIGNGRNLWIYSPEDKEVIESLWDPSSMALQFLLGAGNIKKDFNFRAPTAEEVKSMALTPEETWIYLTPKGDQQKDTGALTALIVEIEPKAKLIEKVIAVDPIGNETHWAFKKIKLDETISDARFEFKIPKNAQVIHY